MNQPTLQQLEAAIKTWNEKYPSGTPVRRFSMMKHSPGDEFSTTATRSEAWIMGGHSPVVLVEGHTGAQHLDQLEVITGQPQSHIPAADTLPTPPKPKRSGAFFPADVAQAVSDVYQAADEHNDPAHFINAVIMQLQAPRPSAD